MSFFERDLSLVFLVPKFFSSKSSSFAISNKIFLSVILARSILLGFFSYRSQKISFQFRFLSEWRNVNKLSNRVTCIVLIFKRSFALIESGAFTCLNWIVYSGIVIFCLKETAIELLLHHYPSVFPKHCRSNSLVLCRSL